MSENIGTIADSTRDRHPEPVVTRTNGISDLSYVNPQIVRMHFRFTLPALTHAITTDVDFAS